MTPSQENWTSPATARATLKAMRRMLRKDSSDGVLTCQAQLVRRVTIGPQACFCFLSIDKLYCGRWGAYFEHLNKGNIQVEVDDVAADETTAVKNADGDDHADVGSAVHTHSLATVEHGGGSGEKLSSKGCEDEMPCC